MLLLLEWVIIFCVATAFMVGLYLTVRHFHRKWKWADKVNENAIRRATLEEFDVQYEVDPQGFIRSVPRSSRGHGRVH